MICSWRVPTPKEGGGKKAAIAVFQMRWMTSEAHIVRVDLISDRLCGAEKEGLEKQRFDERSRSLGRPSSLEVSRLTITILIINTAIGI